MKVALFSDVHAIPEIWDVIYAHMQTHHPDGYWCLGDIIGRGYNPIRMTQTLKLLYDSQPPEHQQAWVKGNHDLNITEGTFYVLDGKASNVMMNSRDLAIDIWHHQRLVNGGRQDLLEWIAQLPVYAPNIIPDTFAGVHAVHGRFVMTHDGLVDKHESVWEPCKDDAHIHDQVQTLTTFQNGTVPRIILNGHTHIPMIALYDATTQLVQRYNVTQAHTIHLGDKQTLVVNTGSVSFPRKDINFPNATPNCALYALLHFTSPDDVVVQFEYVRLPKDTLRIPHDYDEHYGGELKGLCSHE